MFLSSQLEEIARRHPQYVAELRGFLLSRGVPVDSAETLPSLAERLSEDRLFCRGVSTLVESILYREPGEVSYADLLGVLMVAARGTAEPVSSMEQDEATHYLLGFLMHLRESMRTTVLPSVPPPVPVQEAVPAVVPVVAPMAEPAAVSAPETVTPFEAYDEDEPQKSWLKRNALPMGSAAVLLLVLGGYGAWYGMQKPLPAEDAVVSTAPPVVQTVPSQTEEAPVEQSVPVPVEKPVHPAGKEKTHPGTPVAKAAPPVTVRQASTARAQVSAPVRTVPQVASAAPATDSVQAVPPVNQTASAAPVRRRLPMPAVRPRRVPGLGTGEANTTVPLLWTAPTAAPAEPKVSAPTVTQTALGVMASNLIYSPTPSYPVAASAAHVEGQVKVEATVGNDGNVTSARVISGPAELRDAALGAVQRWHYRPYVEGGKARTMTTTALLDFQLP